jgi:monothiol glutaredoxin
MFIRAFKQGLRMFSVDKSNSHPDFHAFNLSEVYNPIEFIDTTIKSNKVVLFMKGTPESPQCGFSNYVVQALKHYNIKNYYYVNILENQVIREEVKKYSDWPTFPQLYLNKEFIGGCDILADMHKNNTLQELFEKHGVISKD